MAKGHHEFISGVGVRKYTDWGDDGIQNMCFKNDPRCPDQRVPVILQVRGLLQLGGGFPDSIQDQEIISRMTRDFSTPVRR